MPMISGHTRLGAIVLAALVSTATMVSAPLAASASSYVTHDVPGTLWMVPGEGNLGMIVQWIYVSPEPAPGPGQVPATYAHVVQFFTSSGQPGYLALATDAQGTRQAGVELSGWTWTPFPWSPGHLYALIAYSPAPDTWAGLVYDQTADAWTPIGQRTVDNIGSSLLPMTRTHVIAGSASACSDYPRDDTYVVPTVGVRDGVSTLGLQLGPYVQAGDCTSQITDESGWVHYQLGVLPT